MKKTDFASLIIAAVLFTSFAQAANYNRHLVQESGVQHYVVTSRAPHLYMISRDLYGTENYWKDIAQWNNLKAPYALQLGQQLILKKEPTQSRAEADESLISSWTKLNRMDVVEGIQSASEGPAPASTETAVKADAQATAQSHSEVVITTKPVQTAPTAATPALPPPTPQKVQLDETPAALAPVPAEPVAAVPATTSQSKTPRPPKESHGHKWHTNVAFAASAFRLENKNLTSNISNTLNSDVDYGVEVEFARNLTEEMEFFVGAAYDRMELKEAGEGVHIEGEKQDLWKFMAGVQRELSHSSAVQASVIYEQLPFATPTAGGAEVTALYIPQISAGAKLGLLNRGSFNSWFVFNGLLLLPRSEEDHDVKAGEGFTAGLRFQNQLARHALTYGVTYRYIQQNTSDTENNQKGVFGNLGILF